MKKFTKIFAFAMALMMVFALQVPVSAAEKGAVIEAGVEAPEATVMTDVTKEQASLQAAYDLFQEYKEVKDGIDGAKELMKENDPEIKEMAKMEFRGIADDPLEIQDPSDRR